jgi:Right handed beta helix region
VDVGLFSRGVLDGTNPPVAELRSMFNARLERIWLSGLAGILITGSRNFLTAVRTFQDRHQTSGIVIDSGGESIIDGPRIDGLAGNSGDGIRLVNSSNISIRNASFEGKGGRDCIRIENSSNVTLDNCNMGGGSFGSPDWSALWITGNSENIRIEGGRINVHDITGVRIDGGARSIRGNAIEFPQSSGAAIGSFLKVDPTVPDVQIESFTGSDARVEFTQTLGAALMRGTTVLLRRWESVRVSGAVTIEDIGQGEANDGPSFASVSPGRRVTLFLSGGAVTVASGGSSKIRLSTGVSWTPAADAMIELVFDGTRWCEVGRNS